MNAAASFDLRFADHRYRSEQKRWRYSSECSTLRCHIEGQIAVLLSERRAAASESENERPGLFAGRVVQIAAEMPVTEPPQNQECGVPAFGSHLRCLTAKRWFRHGSRMPGFGSHNAFGAGSEMV
jgi:hypothetical protein